MKPPGPVTMLTGFASRYAQATVLPSGASVTIPTDIEPTVEPALGGANDDQNGDGDTTNENDNVCFPIGESVILESGSRVPVEQLELGSVVMSRGAGSFSRVFVFSHRDRDVWSTFVRLQFEGPHGRGRIRLSPRHYIYRMRDGCGAVSCSEDSVMVMAQDVQAGDLLVGMHGSPMSVIGLDFVQARGLYNPHTLDGDLVVSGVRVSVYTASVEPQIASALLAPVRGVFQLGWRGMSVWLSESVLYGAWNGWLCKLISL